jgi:hypothetical protein
MVTGGLAAVVYGHPRLTLDVDLPTLDRWIVWLKLGAEWERALAYNDHE